MNDFILKFAHKKKIASERKAVVSSTRPFRAYKADPFKPERWRNRLAEGQEVP